MPNDTVSASTNVSFKSDGTPVIFLEIQVSCMGHNIALSNYLFLQFPILCPFERLNYSILLIQLNDGRETVVIELQRSAMTPTESVSERIDSGLQVNANYSVTVHAATDVWDASATYYNISESWFCSSVCRHKENLLCTCL